jgi:[glutamine synthetase] adenylyltransferase / [glutamine synthetase]-adenylyl-L-tyrosine phosphorylase
VEHNDPRKFDWPIPEPDSAEEQALVADESIQAAAEGLQKDLARLPAPLGERFAELLADCFDHSPAPSESVLSIERAFAAAPESILPLVEAALLSPRSFRRMFTLLGHSRLLSRHLLRHGWREFLQLGEDDLAHPITAEDVAQRTRERVSEGTSIRHAMRLTHHQFAARVLYREAVLQRPLTEIGAEISALADGAIAVALEHAQVEFKKRGGPDDLRFCVIAMGKHGGNELNYSSDIDLMFVYESAAPDAQRHAVRLAEGLIPLIDDVTEHGRVFRVDTRLRPEGKRGRLARSLQSTVDYYYSFGSTWERQALIKARPAAGDLPLGDELIERLSGWVFRKYLTVEEINRIQGLKRTIEQRTDQRAETFTDVKTGFGGIRDIEFVTQFLQLMNGGRIPELRARDTLTALDMLARHGVLNPHEALELADAYRFLRAVEHRLQLWEGMQTHTLPTNAADLARVGRCLGLRGPKALDPARRLVHMLQAHTLKSRGLMVRLFAGLFDAHNTPAESLLVMDPDLTPEAAGEILKPYGFKDTAAAFRAIRDLARESPENRLYEPRARKYLASMMPTLLEFCAESPEPDFTLHNFERVCAKLGAKTMLFELVAEDPRALRVFGSIAAHSRWLTDILTRRPGLVDEFTDELQTFTVLSREQLAADLKQRTSYAADFADALHWQRDVELLRIGLFDVTGRTPLPETLRELSTLAEVLLEAALHHALKLELERLKDDRPVAELADALAVIGMGKLGAGALNYASDLDLVFTYLPGSFDDAADAQTFFNRVTRRVREILGGAGERGKLYEVDLRLRPHGGASSLAVSTDELERYLNSQADYWERIAATRARVLNPDTPAGKRAQQLIEDFCYGRPPDVEKVREMRARIERESPGNALKRGAGGTLDIEFMLAHLQMVHGANEPRMRSPQLFETMQAARDLGLLSLRDHDAAAGAYAFLRQVVNRLQILDGVSRHELPADEAGLEVFARRLGYKEGGGLSAAGQLTEELNWHRQSARKVYERVVGAQGYVS